jgi:hypothetical protein
MMTDFHRELGTYIKTRQNADATKLILRELGVCLVKDKDNFVEVLNNARVPASIIDSDTTLIEKFSQNALSNKKLLLGASLLVNHKNQTTNFDGELQVSDAGVKNTYKVLYDNLIGDEEERSNFLPLIMAGVKLLGKKKENAEKKKADTSAELMKSVVEQRRKEAEAKALKVNEAKKKTNKIIIIGGSLLVVTLLAVVIYKASKK